VVGLVAVERIFKHGGVVEACHMEERGKRRTGLGK